MNIKFYFLALLFPFTALGQTIVWTDVIPVNTNTNTGYTRPQIVITNGSIPVVMWGKANNQGVYVSRWYGNGFGAPVEVTPNGVNAFVQDWAGPGMAAKGDTVFVTFKSQPENEGYVYVVKSTDGGFTFGDTIRVSDNNWSRFPAVSVDQNGNPYVSYMEFDPNWSDPRYVVHASTDGGSTFSSAVDASAVAPGEVCDCCPSFILADQGKVLQMFRNNDNNLRDIWASVSTDAGSTFSLGADVDNNNWVIGGCPSTGPNAIMTQDSIIAVWMSGGGGASAVNIGTSSHTNLGVGMNADINPFPSANQNYPKIAGDGNTLGVVWQESYTGNTEIKFMYTTEGIQGLLEATPDTVNSSLSGNQKNPSIAYGENTFVVVWQDQPTNSVLYRIGIVSPPTSVGNVGQEKAIQVYPNPSTGNFSVTLPEVGDIALMDISGKLIRSEFVNSPNRTLNFEGISKGVYLLKFKATDFELHKKIVVQ